MNRLFFRPEQAGMTKTEAAAQTLMGINPDVAIESYTMNITTLQGFDDFKASICNADGASRVDLILSCVDNYEARMTINQVLTSSCQCMMASIALDFKALESTMIAASSPYCAGRPEPVASRRSVLSWSRPGWSLESQRTQFRATYR